MSLSPVKIYKLWNRVNDRFGAEEEDDDKGKKKINPKAAQAEKENKRIDKGLFKLRRIAKSDMGQDSNVDKFEKTQEKTVKSMKKYCKMLKGDALREQVQDLTKFRKAMKQLTVVVENLEPKPDQEDEEGQADLNLLNSVDVATLDKAMEDPNFGAYSDEELAGLETDELEGEEQEDQEEQVEQEEAPAKHPVQERFEALAKDYDAAVAKNGPDMQRMQMLHRAIEGLLRNKDYPQAERVLDELEGLVAKALGTKPPSAEDRRGMALFQARLKSLQPAIKRAMTVPAPEVPTLKQSLVTANASARANEFQKAQATLDQVETLVKQILRNIPKAPPPPDKRAETQAPTPPGSDDQFTNRLKSLMAKAITAGKANPELAQKLKLLFSEAQVFNRKKDSSRASGLLDQAADLINKATPPAPPPPKPVVVDAAAWEKALAAVEPRYLQALREGSGDVSKLKTLFAFAQQQAEKEKFDSAVQTLAKLGDLLSAAKNGAPAGDIPKGLVGYRKALLGLGAAIRAVNGQLSAFRTKMASTMPEEADVADELADQIAGLNSELQDSIDKAMNTAKDDREPYNAATKAMIRTMVDKIKANPLVKHVDVNPFSPTKVEDTLTAALLNIEKTMV